MMKLRCVFCFVGVSAVLLTVPLEAVAKDGGVRGSSGGSHRVRSYTKKDGTYVPGHRQTNPDGTKINNWSTKGNVNPYTGKPGTKNP
jgi:hypothetical protein